MHFSAKQLRRRGWYRYPRRRRDRNDSGNTPSYIQEQPGAGGMLLDGSGDVRRPVGEFFIQDQRARPRLRQLRRRVSDYSQSRELDRGRLHRLHQRRCLRLPVPEFDRRPHDPTRSKSCVDCQFVVSYE